MATTAPTTTRHPTEPGRPNRLSSFAWWLLTVVASLVLGAAGAGIAQQHGHLVPSQICFTFDNGDKPCYNARHDHAKLDYYPW
jgi:hypothetical protein